MRKGHEKSNRVDKTKKPDYREQWVTIYHSFGKKRKFATPKSQNGKSKFAKHRAVPSSPKGAASFEVKKPLEAAGADPLQKLIASRKNIARIWKEAQLTQVSLDNFRRAIAILKQAQATGWLKKINKIQLKQESEMALSKDGEWFFRHRLYEPKDPSEKSAQNASILLNLLFSCIKHLGGCDLGTGPWKLMNPNGAIYWDRLSSYIEVQMSVDLEGNPANSKLFQTINDDCISDAVRMIYLKALYFLRYQELEPAVRKIACVQASSMDIPARSRDDKLLLKLKACRLELAARDGVPRFVIFSDRTLEEMSSIMPPHKESAMKIKGVVSRCNWEKYLPPMLEVIRQHQRKMQC